MANSKRLPKNNLVDEQSDVVFNHLKLFVRSFLKQHQLANPSFLIAYSGGLDSTVLLHALHRLQADIPFRLSAMHVHHGLSQQADAWAALCQQHCAKLAVPFQLTHVNVNQKSGLGLEAAARQVRYEALYAASADFICLAHHQDDQAETLLLQLARGAGVKGLAGMAKIDLVRRLIRPLLDLKRDDLLAYAEQYDLQWVEDESNADTAFDRNFMRQTLVPALSSRYPSITKTLARSASHFAEANELLEALAAIDAAQVIEASQMGQVLKLAALQLLSHARQVNVLRFWLGSHQVMQPSAAVLQQLLQQLHSTRTDTSIRVKVATGLFVMRYNGLACLVEALEQPAPIDMHWQGEEVITLPDSSRLFFTHKQGEGLAYQRDGLDSSLTIKTRAGGETFKPELDRPRRRLKTILQASEIPPWQRERLPLIFMGEQLAVIPNIGIDATLKAADNEVGLLVRWQP